MYWILITDNIVQGTIVADQDFIDHIKSRYDLILPVGADGVRPSPGSLYLNGQYTEPGPDNV